MMPNKNNRGSVFQMIQTLEFCSTEDDREASPFLGMAAKALAQLQCHNDMVTAAAVAWKDKYEQMEQLYNELVEKTGDLAEENDQLLIKCEQLEVDESMQNDMLAVKIGDLAEENEKLESELMSYRTSFEASPMKDTATIFTDSSSLSGDIYAQLDQFEDSLNMELEDLQQLGLFENMSVVATASSGEKEKNTREMIKKKYFMTPVKNLLQEKALETIKDTPTSPNMNPLQLFQRMFQTQTQDAYDDVPAMVTSTSNSLMSLSSSDCSFSTTSSSDHFSLTPTKRMSPYNLMLNGPSSSKSHH